MITMKTASAVREKQTLSNIAVRHSGRGHLGDLKLLGSEPIRGSRQTSRTVLPRGSQFAARPFDEWSGADGLECIPSGAQRATGLGDAPLPSKPTAIGELAASHHQGKGCVFTDRGLEQGFGFAVAGEQGTRKPQARLEDRRPRLRRNRLEG